MTEIEGQKDVLPELEPNPYTSISLNLGHALAQRNAQFLAHIRSTREEIQRLRVGISLVCELHGCASETCTAAQYHEDAQKLIRRVETSEEKMKRAVEVLKEEVAKPWYNSGIYSLTAIARKAISILSPDTEGGGK